VYNILCVLIRNTPLIFIYRICIGVSPLYTRSCCTRGRVKLFINQQNSLSSRTEVIEPMNSNFELSNGNECAFRVKHIICYCVYYNISTHILYWIPTWAVSTRKLQRVTAALNYVLRQLLQQSMNFFQVFYYGYAAILFGKT